VVDGAASLEPTGLPSCAVAETCRVVGLEVPLWELHRERLSQGGCGEALLADVERRLETAIRSFAGERTSRLRAHVEVAADGSVAVEVARRLSSLDVVNGPVLVPVSVIDLPTPPVLPASAAKPVDRSWWDAASRAAHRGGGHQALIFDADGFVIDGSSASVWGLIEGALVTTPAPPAIAGVARRFVQRAAPALGLTVRVRPLQLQQLESADEILLTNAFGGAVAARGHGGPATRAVQSLFADIWAR